MNTGTPRTDEAWKSSSELHHENGEEAWSWRAHDMRKKCAELERENARLRESAGWKPIETAPKDRLIDVWTIGFGGDSHYIAYCYYDRFCDEWRTSRPKGYLFMIPARFCTHWREITGPIA